MTTPKPKSTNTAAFYLQAIVAFGISLTGTIGGIYYLPIDSWQKSFLIMSALFLVTSCFTLAKVIRDQTERDTVRERIDEARLEKLLADHDPFKTAA